MSSGIDVFLTQGQNESITVEADDNLHEYIKTEITGNTLKVYSEANIRRAEAKKVHVTMKDIEKISVSSAGDIFGENLIRSDDLYLKVSSAGDLKAFDLKTRIADVSTSSAGSISLKDICCL